MAPIRERKHGKNRNNSRTLDSNASTCDRSGGGLAGRLRQTLAPAPVESQNEAVTSAVPRTSWGAPDLAGIWDFRTSTPLQRPEEFGDRASLTDEEAAEFEEGAVDRLFARARAVGGSESNVELWPDRGTEMAGDNRTSLIVDPPDGRVPPRTSSGQRGARRSGPFRSNGIPTVPRTDRWPRGASCGRQRP